MRLVINIILLSFLAFTPKVSYAQIIRVDAPVMVSSPGSGGHFWGTGNSQAAPDDPLSLITCGILVRTDPLSWAGYLYASTDGGRTWRASYIDETLSEGGVPDQVSETSCAIGRRGSTYMNTSVWGRFYSRPFQLMSSTDGGNSWSEPLRRSGWYDATRSVVDNSGGRFDGRLYIFSNRISNGGFAKFNSAYQPLLFSADSGRSVHAASAERPSARYLDAGWPSQAIVLADGKVIAVHIVQFRAPYQMASSNPFGENSELYGVDLVSSSNGGQSLDSPMTIARWTRSRALQTGELQEVGGTGDFVAALAADNSGGAYTGRVYVAWREADTAGPSSRIMLSWSPNGGVSWSKPKRVDDSAQEVPVEPNSELERAADPMMPALAVNKDGMVGLMWMERRNSPSWRFAVSVNGGVKFSDSTSIYTTRKTDGQFRTQWFNQYMTAADYPIEWIPSIIRHPDKVGFTLYTQAGDFGTLTATIDGVFHALWTTKSDGAIWATRITADVHPSSQAQIETRGLRDVSKHARLEVQTFQYDEASGRVLLDVELINTTIPVPDRFPRLESRPQGALELEIPGVGRPGSFNAPVVLRFTNLRSEVGELELVNADGVDSSGTPLVDWSKALSDCELLPGRRSGLRRLELRINHLKRSAHPDVIRALAVTAEVFAK